MAFQPKSPKQMNYLHSLAGDKKKSGGPITPASLLAAPIASAPRPVMPVAPPGPAPMVKPMPVAVTHTPQAPMPKMMPPQAPMNPMAAPSLPSTGNLPKFGKMRNSLRGSPFNKSNKA
jgi:hypothetical protein